MPIILMSSGNYFTEHAEERLGMDFGGFKIAYVTTAVIPAKDKDYYFRRKERMDELGWDYEEVNLVVKDDKELSKFFKDKDIIFVEGGSAFYLLKAIKGTNFEEIVRNHLEKGGIYAGASAGAYVACPNILPATWFNAKNWDYCGLTEFTAMSLVPYLLKVHYDPDEHDKILNEKREESFFEIRTLTDEEAVIEEYGNTDHDAENSEE